MDADLQSIWKMFREAVIVLSLPAEEQRRVNGPGCLVCDLLEDFDHWRRTFLSHFGDVLTPPQVGVLAEMQAIIDQMDDADHECWNDEVVRRPAWQQLREKASEAVHVFGYEGVTVNPSVETEPGVWRRMPPE